MGASQQALLTGSGGIGPQPLDSYITDLWACCSIKLLLSAYTGSLIRVRRSSDNAEQDIGASGTALDTSALATFGGSDSVFVKTFYDQSGAGNDFTQATTGAQPRIVNAGTYDGKLVFDGSNDGMATANSMPSTAAASFIMDYKIRAAAAIYTLLHQGNLGVAANNTFGFQFENVVGRIIGYMFTGAPSAGNYFSDRWVANANDGKDLFTADRSGSGSARASIYRNGSLQTLDSNPDTAATAGSHSSERFFLGLAEAGTQPGLIDLRTLVIWKTNQTANAVGINAAI